MRRGNRGNLSPPVLAESRRSEGLRKYYMEATDAVWAGKRAI